MASELTEKKISSQSIWTGRIFEVKRDTVELPDGKQALRDYIVHPGGAVILPVDGDGNCYLVRQWRYPQGEAVLEAPAGKLEPGEDPREAALRELGEEVGFTADEVVSLGVAYPTTAYVRECMNLFVARGLTPTTQHLDDGEFLDIVKLPMEEAVRMVMAGEIPDAKTQILLLRTYLTMHN